jgi:aminoglycoside 3-N-acetyltransferase
MKDFFRKLISLILTQESGNTINASLYKFKNKHKSIFRFIYGTAGDEDIYNNVLKKLPDKFDILMVHSSLNDMVPMYTGSLNKLLSLLLSFCQEKNVTLAMPAFFSGSNWEAGKYYENGKHIFDVRKTFSQMGMLSELFRRTANVKRSIHPTHSICALGPLADVLTKGHHLADSSFGEGTPFGEVVKYRTIILGIGTRSPQPLTQVNSAPDIMKDEFPVNLYLDTIPVTCVDEAGNNLVYNLRIRKREFRINRYTVKKIMRGKIIEWTYKGIPFVIAEADMVNRTIIEAARRGNTIYE